MIHPESIYRYRRHVAPDRSTGTRWDYQGHEGHEYPELIKTLKRDSSRVIYHGLNTRNHKIGIWLGKDADKPKETGWITEVYEPDIKRPGKGFGDLNRADALLTNRDEQADTLTILIFPGLGKQAEVLFLQWGTGAVRESISSNNVILSTVSVHPDPK